MNFQVRAALFFLVGLSLGPFADAQALLEQALLNAQIRNQEAQAEYYRRLATPWQGLVPVFSGVAGTLLGAWVAFLTLKAQTRSQAKLEDTRWEHARADENARWERARADEFDRWSRTREDEEARRRVTREDERRKELRLAVADFAKKMAAAAHSMTWLLWAAKHDVVGFSKTQVDEHDQRMNILYSEIAAAQAVIAALDANIYDKTAPLTAELYTHDGAIAKLALHLPDSREALGLLWEDASNFETKVARGFIGLLEEEASRSTHAPASKKEVHA